MAQERGTNGPVARITVPVDKDLEDLIPGFLENRRKDVGTLRAAVSRGDYETVRILGHTMRGDGGGYGFDAISDIGGALEAAAKVKSLDEIHRWIGELAGYLDRVDVVYE